MQKEDYLFEKEIFNGILVFSLQEGKFKFPAQKELVLSELVKGTIDYLGGRVPKIETSEIIKEPKYHSSQLCHKLEREIDSEDAIALLEPKFRKTMKSLCKGSWYRIETPEVENCFDVGFYPYLENLTRDIFQGEPLEKTFSLPYELVDKIRKQPMPCISGDVLENILGVGRCMRNYIEKDLDFIGR